MPEKFGKSNLEDCVDVRGEENKILEYKDENCKTIQNFKKYAQIYDSKWDKFERIVKLSRDITIESKRIIFLLHTIKRENKKNSTLNEAERRLETLVSNHFKKIAKELDNEDPYQYHRAFSPGVEEFIEAFTYFNYLKNDKIFHWNHYQDKLKYNLTEKTSESENVSSDTERKIFTTLVPKDYILGLADMTGEIMRRCINNFGLGEIDGCFKTCALVKNIYTGFLTIDAFQSKEMSHKMFVLKKSLLKMEMVCYNICIRGTEICNNPRMAIIERSYDIYVDEDE